MDCERRRQWLDLFVPVIDNWAVCDSCCITYKWMRSKPEYWWEYAWNWILADTEYGIRFGLIVILGHFVDAAHIDKIFTNVRISEGNAKFIWTLPSGSIFGDSQCPN